MKIKVQEVSSEGMRISLVDYATERLRKSVGIEGPVEGKLLITKQGANDLHIRGAISTHLLLTCGRCLIPFSHAVKSEFYIDCTPAVKTSFRQEHRLCGEDLNLHFYKGESLDLDEIIENQLYLEMPMAPLCRTDCPGLCQNCGETLNGTLHDCLK